MENKEPRRVEMGEKHNFILKHPFDNQPEDFRQVSKGEMIFFISIGVGIGVQVGIIISVIIAKIFL